MATRELSFYKSKSFAFQSGWLCARDGKPHDLVYGPPQTLKDYNEGYAAYVSFSQVHSPSKKG